MYTFSYFRSKCDVKDVFIEFVHKCKFHWDFSCSCRLINLQEYHMVYWFIHWFKSLLNLTLAIHNVIKLLFSNYPQFGSKVEFLCIFQFRSEGNIEYVSVNFITQQVAIDLNSIGCCLHPVSLFFFEVVTACIYDEEFLIRTSMDTTRKCLIKPMQITGEHWKLVNWLDDWTHIHIFHINQSSKILWCWASILQHDWQLQKVVKNNYFVICKFYLLLVF